MWEFSCSDGTRALYEEAMAVPWAENRTQWNIWKSSQNYCAALSWFAYATLNLKKYSLAILKIISYLGRTYSTQLLMIWQLCICYLLIDSKNQNIPLFSSSTTIYLPKTARGASVITQCSWKWHKIATDQDNRKHTVTFIISVRTEWVLNCSIVKQFLALGKCFPE